MDFCIAKVEPEQPKRRSEENTKRRSHESSKKRSDATKDETEIQMTNKEIIKKHDHGHSPHHTHQHHHNEQLLVDDPTLPKLHEHEHIKHKHHMHPYHQNHAEGLHWFFEINPRN